MQGKPRHHYKLNDGDENWRPRKIQTVVCGHLQRSLIRQTSQRGASEAGIAESLRGDGNVDAPTLAVVRYGTVTPHRRSTRFAKPNGAGVNGPGGARVMSAVQNSATMASQKHSQKPSI